MMTATAIGLIAMLSISITFLIRWQLRERKFMLFESLLCVGMAAIIFEVLTKFILILCI